MSVFSSLSFASHQCFLYLPVPLLNKLAGYSNNHMGYFCTPDEYDIGGYESQLTFWGINTSKKVRDACHSVSSKLANN